VRLEDKEGAKRINKINKSFSGKELIVGQHEKLSEQKMIRQIRSDKQHDIKFPVNEYLYIKLKDLNKQLNEQLKQKRKKEITQTVVNTKLLRFGLKNDWVINWDIHYKDSKRYMHTNLLETEYEKIGGRYGYSMTKMMSDRKVVTIIILSVLNYLESGGDINEVLQ